MHRLRLRCAADERQRAEDGTEAPCSCSLIATHRLHQAWLRPLTVRQLDGRELGQFALKECLVHFRVFILVWPVCIEYFSIAILNADALGGRRQAVDESLRIQIAIPKYIREMAVDPEHGDFERLQLQAIGRITAALEAVAVHEYAARIRIVLG